MTEITKTLKNTVAKKTKPFTIFDLLELPKIGDKLRAVPREEIHAALLKLGCDTVDEIEGAIFYAPRHVIHDDRGVFML